MFARLVRSACSFGRLARPARLAYSLGLLARSARLASFVLFVRPRAPGFARRAYARRCAQGLVAAARSTNARQVLRAICQVLHAGAGLGVIFRVDTPMKNSDNPGYQYGVVGGWAPPGLGSNEPCVNLHSRFCGWRLDLVDKVDARGFQIFGSLEAQTLGINMGSTGGPRPALVQPSPALTCTQGVVVGVWTWWTRLTQDDSEPLVALRFSSGS